MAAFDHPDTIRHFLTQMNSQPKHMNLNNITSSITTPNDQPANGHDSTIHTAADNDNSEYNKSEGAMTPLVPPRSTLASQDHHQHWTSPEAHPKPSPHLSGLKAPQNTPKTAASSPRLAAINIHNQDVADAFSEYVNNMDGRPLSESIWAPASAPQKPSMLGGARSTSVLTPIKAVVPNPAINDTFDRMTFKAADTDHNAGKNLIGDRVTRSLYSNVPASFINKSCVLADKVHGDTTDHGQAKPEAAGDEGLESPAYTKTVDKGQVKEDGAVSKNTPNTTHSDHVEKENDTRSTSTAYLPPHLRAVRGSGTRVPAQNLSQSSPSESSRTHSSSDQKPATSESSVKTETDSLGTEGFPLPVTSKVADPGPVKDIVQAATNDAGTEVTIDTAGAKPLTDTSSASEDLEGKIFFDVWPKGEERSRPAAKIRKVIIKDLPHGSTATFVASLVYGGRIEEIQVRSSAAGDLSAVIRFMDAGDCMKFYDETSNGLVYKQDAKGRELVVFVELCKDVDVVGGLLQGWILSGVTRCVRAVGVEADWGMDRLVKIAERKNRKVEKIVDVYYPGGARSVVFRFCKVDDAVQFKAARSRDEEWEHCNIQYADDPCATATGVHFEE